MKSDLYGSIISRIKFLRELSILYKVLAPIIIALIVALGYNGKTAYSTIIVITILLSLLIALIIKALVLRPLRKIITVIKKLADGDLTVSMENHFEGELGEIAGNLNKMIANFNELVGNTMKNSSLLASSAEQFSATSDENTQGASEQAGKIETAFESVHIFTESIEHISSNADLAKVEVTETKEAAAEGHEIIMQTVTNMSKTSKSVLSAASNINELGERSKQVGNITAVIREITNKTNLLALNAAIEAARAGEHGQGFAVVADEVRKLAERTSQATKEIESTIESIQDSTDSVVALMKNTTSEVEESVALVQKGGHALTRIIEKIDSVSSEIGAIVEAISVQKETSRGLLSDMEQVSTVAQGFTINANESSKASAELSKLAMEIETMIHNFKIKAVKQ